VKHQTVGYIRVSTIVQNTERQLAGIKLDRIFEERLSGKDTERPQLREMLSYVRQGDTVLVHSLDRLGRNLDDLRGIVKELNGKGVTVRFMKEGLEFTAGTSNPFTELMLNMLGAFAQFERSLILERQREGIQIAKQNGAYKGRKQEMTDDRIAEIKARIANGEPKAKIAKAMGISRDTLYRYA
jgi:DNA invertase Pin-like site-specific DNA recombinase